MALENYDRAIALNPNYPEAYNNRGVVLVDLRRLAQALESYDHAIALNPNYPEAYNNRGAVLQNLKRPDEALASCDRAITLKPDFANAYNNRGIILRDLKMPDQALANYDRAIALEPDYAEAYTNRGNVLRDMRVLDEAQASYDRAIALKPDYASSYFNKSLLKLLTGDFREGWQLYEWRWKGFLKNFVRGFVQPLWLGDQPIAGKTLLIYAEQGLGDFIQFCRYAIMAESLGAKVVLEVREPLVLLISALQGNFTVIGKGNLLPHFDLHCPVMSLPLAFKTTVANIPSRVPYLNVDQHKQIEWQRKLGNKTKLRVGLVWSGSTDHTNDYNRSIPLQILEPLLQLPIEFHSLQKDIQPDDVSVLSRLTQIHSHQAELNNFSDTAALIQEMDLVISVDTSVAHLAGAMGKLVWILLPLAPDFRWMLDRTDSPWYPTATLFRQSAIDGWPNVVSEVVQRLEKMKFSS